MKVEKRSADISSAEPALDIAPDSVPNKPTILEEREIFHDAENGVKFRTVSWPRAAIIFLKIQFAMSILSVPGALATLGAVGGSLSIVGWEVLNTCKSKSSNLVARLSKYKSQTRLLY